MKKKWLFIFAAFFALATVVFLITRPNKSETNYKGVRLSRWIEITSGTSDLQKGLAEIGPESIPYLRRALHTTDNPIRRLSVWVWGRLPVSTRAKYRAYEVVEGHTVRGNALWGLRLWGPEAREALPDLKELATSERNLMNKNLLYDAIAAVDGNSTDGLQTLRQLLKSEDAVTRSQAAGAIFEAPTHDPAIVSLLIENIKRSPDKPYNELLALGAIGTNAAPALPLLIEALKDPATRNNTLTALTGIGDAAAPALPTLTELIARGELQLKPEVIEVIIHVGPPASNAVPMLRTALEGQEPVARAMAAMALGRIQQDVESAIPVLIAELSNRGSAKEQHWLVWLPNMHSIGFDHRETAAWLLGEIGPPAKDAVPELQKAMRSNQRRHKILAARALWRITGQANETVAVLALAMGNTDEETCTVAAQALGEMGPAAILALPTLLNARTNSLYVRRAVNEALKKIDPEMAARVIHRPPQ